MFRAWIDSFKADHPDVTVEWLDKTGSDWATFYQAQLVAGTPPDIINVQGTLWAEYAANDYVMDLTPYLDKNPEVRARFSDRILDYWTLGGKVYGLPYYVNKSLLYYNKLLFEKAGIDGPPKTVDELLQQAEKISQLGDETQVGSPLKCGESSPSAPVRADSRSTGRALRRKPLRARGEPPASKEASTARLCWSLSATCT